MKASEKETIPKEDPKKEEEPAKETNGEKNGDATEAKPAPAAVEESKEVKLSLGEIAAIDGEIAKAKTEQLQVLHNVSAKNGAITNKISFEFSILAFLRQKRKRPAD